MRDTHYVANQNCRLPTIAAEMLRAVASMAIEAAEEAERMLRDEDHLDRRRIADLELRQAQYDASLAERRYATCDPDNRLIGAQLERAGRLRCSVSSAVGSVSIESLLARFHIRADVLPAAPRNGRTARPTKCAAA